MSLQDPQKQRWEIVSLVNPFFGLGWQALGAFNRLGIKSRALCSPDASTRAKDLNHCFVSEWDFYAPQNATAPIQENNLFVLYPEKALHQGTRAPEPWMERLIQSLDTLRRTSPSAGVLLLLPKQCPESDLQRILESFPDATIFLCPMVMGFRDDSLFDRLIDLLESAPHTLLQDLSSTDKELEFCLMSDLVAFVSSLASTIELEEAVYQIPPQSFDAKKFVDVFNKHFLGTPTVWHKIRAPFARPPLLKILKPFFRKSTSERLSKIPSLLEVLPSPLTPLERWMRDSAKAYRANPQAREHFPPSRNL